MSTPPDRKPGSTASHAVPPSADPSHPTAAPGEGGTQWQPRPTWALPTTADGIHVPGYEIQGELGRGGMGVVYLATNVLMKRPEVLKIVNKSLLESSPGMAERFLREIQAAARLDHENVVKAHSALRVGELLIFVMEYVEGEDLAKLVQRQGPLPVTHACHYISQAAMGLQHAHEKGMIHRDVKPHNLILTRRGKRHVVKILDFGLAKAVQGDEAATFQTTTGAVLGTPAFMAPEQALDAARADIRSDIYSLGCTLYYLLTGAPPFTGKSYLAMMKAHESAPAPSLIQLRAGASAELAAVAVKMLAKEPGRRYQQPVDVAKALAPIFKAAPTPATGPLPVLPSLTDKATPPPLRRDALVRQSGRDEETKTYFPPSPPARPAPPRRSSSGVWRVVLGVVAGIVVLAAVGAGATGLLFHPGPAPSTPPRDRAEPWHGTTAGTPPQAALTTAGTSAPTPLSSPPERPSLLDCTGVNGVSAADMGRAQAAWAKYLGRQVEEEDEIAPGARMKFVLVPPGKFLMGSPEGEQDRSKNEVQHEVELTRPFYLAANDVTRGQFRRFVEDANYKTEAEADGKGGYGGWNADQQAFVQDPKYTWRDPGFAQTDDDPVVEVSWSDAAKYAAWLGEKSGNRIWYHLPSEAEWEYSCRGGRPSSLPFGIGNGTSLSSLQANFDGDHPYGGADKGPYLQKTTPVGAYGANTLCLYDMQGNVWQWCSDWYGEYRLGKAVNPQGPAFAEGTSQVFRGGAWSIDARFCRAADRGRDFPGIRISILGFRLARVPSGLDK